MEDTVDLLKIKIEKAKRELPLETINAINAVDWRAAILGLREKKGYTFEQLGDLELETELVLCGLLNPADYQKEITTRMQISKSAADELVNIMNDLVFKKIREELIKNTERKKIFAGGGDAFSSAGINILSGKLELGAGQKIESRENILEKIEKPEKILPIKNPIPIPNPAPIPAPTPVKIETVKEINPLLAQKLSSSFQVGVVKTEHSLDNLTKNKIPNSDPYRELPE